MVRVVRRHVSLLGHAVEIRDDPDFADADRLSMRYLGEPYDRRDRPSVSVVVEVERWHTWGDPRSPFDDRHHPGP